MIETRILALDVATRTGWAFSDGERQESGVASFELKHGESTPTRYVRFSQWLREMLDRYRPEMVIYEQPGARQPSGAAAEVLYALTTRVAEAAELRGLACVTLAPAALKKWATSNGNASKDAMIVAAAEKQRQHVEDWIAHLRRPGGDNEADALLLLFWVQAGCPETQARTARRRPAR